MLKNPKNEYKEAFNMFDMLDEINSETVEYYSIFKLLLKKK